MAAGGLIHLIDADTVWIGCALVRVAIAVVYGFDEIALTNAIAVGRAAFIAYSYRHSGVLHHAFEVIDGPTGIGDSIVLAIAEIDVFPSRASIQIDIDVGLEGRAGVLECA